jgi:LPS sulfotransferase NodH
MSVCRVVNIIISPAIPLARLRMRTGNNCNLDEPWSIWAICTIARSGSSWLSQLVGSTQLLGNPDEYLLDWPRCAARFGFSAALPFEEYISCLIRHRSTPNGVFSIKGSFAELQPFLDLFPCAPCVWLTRDNKLEQAVSWHRAQSSGLWHRTDTAQPQRPFDFCVEEALSFYDEILRREALWQNYFATREVKPFVLTYETLCHDPLASVRAIASYVGIDSTSIVHVQSPLRIVRDKQTTEFVRRIEHALRDRTTSLCRKIAE